MHCCWLLLGTLGHALSSRARIARPSLALAPCAARRWNGMGCQTIHGMPGHLPASCRIVATQCRRRRRYARARTRRGYDATARLPLAHVVVFEKAAARRLRVLSLRQAVERCDDRIEHPRRRVDLVDRRLEVMRLRIRRRLCGGLLVVDPTRVHRGHINVRLRVVGRAGPRHHVERSLGHVRVRVRGLLVL